MTTMFDLGPAADRMAALATAVTDDQLAAKTPCPEYTVADLLAHVCGLSLGFRNAADKAGSPLQDRSPGKAELPADWRTELPIRLSALVASWRAPAAWDGMTRVGGVDLPGSIAGQVALEELVIHGWDIAKATGQSVEYDAETAEAVVAAVRMFASPPGSDSEGPFGPSVPVPDHAPLLDRAVGLSGRDPAWTP